MLRFLASRLATVIGMALLATLAIFLIANTVPGDPVLAQLGDQAASDPAFVARWRHEFGLDLPLWERYFVFLRDLMHGNLGISITSHRPVLEDIKDYAPATLELATIAFIVALVVGIPLGILAAVRRDSWIDHLARMISLMGVSAPTFWLAFIVLAVFYGQLAWAPGPGRLDPISFPPENGTGFFLWDYARTGDWDGFKDAASHLVLPVIVLAAATLGLITRTTRASMLECLRQDYVRMGRAKGLREKAVIVGHVLPNAMIPIVTLGGTGLREFADRRGDDRDGVLLARPRPLHVPERGDARFPGDHGDHPHRRGGLSRHQPVDRPQLRAARPAGAAVSVFVAGLRSVGAAPSRWARYRSWQRRYGLPALGGLLVLAWIVLAIAAPLFAPFPPNTVDVSVRLQPPGPIYLLGTDELGRDVLSRLIYGARISLFTGIVVVFVGGLRRHAHWRDRGLCRRMGRGGA